MSCLALIGQGSYELIELKNRFNFYSLSKFSVQLITGYFVSVLLKIISSLVNTIV